jgi:polyribonucleotide nucleotidyltransferase
MSVNPEVDPDIAALIGVSAALTWRIPFNGPIGAARVGYANGQFILNPTATQLKDSKLNLVVAGTEHAVLMVESEAQQLSEEVMLGSVMFGHQQMQAAIQAINELADTAAKPMWDWRPPAKDDTLAARVASWLKRSCAQRSRSRKSRRVPQPLMRSGSACSRRSASAPRADRMRMPPRSALRWSRKSCATRSSTGAAHRRPRYAYRAPDQHPSRVLPRTHGSALFTRGETRAIVVATLGTARDSQIIDALMGEYKGASCCITISPTPPAKPAVGSPKRREIGHGRLAKRALLATLPSVEDFGYSMRVVSRSQESNGSSSMASVCGASLALMDAGVPMKAHVAGIAMGLIKEGNRFAVLTDILGDEDHLGDMDFKVAGTENGVTALQMDIKIEGITKEIMQVALSQAREGRMLILEKMTGVLPSSRADISTFAPRIIKIKINPDKIRDVIGKGGAVIRALTEETGTTIDIEDDGTVSIACISAEGGEMARKRIEAITADVEVGKIYDGTVLKLLDFGAIVSVLPGKDGLLHISQISQQRVASVADHLRKAKW